MTKRNRQPLLKSRWLLAYVGSVVLFLPWLSVFLSQLGNGALAPISQAMTLENLLGIVSFNFVYQPVWQLDALMSLLVLFVLIALGYIMVRGFKEVSSKERPYLMLFALYILVPIALVTLISLVRPMYVERYLAHVAIGGMTLVGVVVALVTRKKMPRTRLVAGILFVTLLLGTVHLSVVGNYNFQRLQKPAINKIAATIKPCYDDKVILAADPYVAIELSYYLSSCDIRFYSEWAELRGGYAPLSESPLRVSDPARELAQSREVVYVYYDAPKLQMPGGMSERARYSEGALTAVTFTAE